MQDNALIEVKLSVLGETSGAWLVGFDPVINGFPKENAPKEKTQWLKKGGNAIKGEKTGTLLNIPVHKFTLSYNTALHHGFIRKDYR